MTRLATNGFEGGVLATDGWTGGGTHGAYDSTIKNTGANSYKFTSGSVPGTDLITRAVAAVLDRTYWHRVYWRAASATPTGTHMILEVATNAGGFWSEIDFNAIAGKLSWQRTGGPGNQDLGITVVAGQWYCIDYGVRHNTAGTATFEVWVDNVQKGSFSAASGFGTVWQKVVLGNDASANYTTDAWWDDYAVNDDQGASPDNGRIGTIQTADNTTKPAIAGWFDPLLNRKMWF